MRTMISAALLVLGIAVAATAAQDSRPPQSKPAAVAPVNLNTATTAQLESLPGIGSATANRILEYRTQHGGFKKIEELMNVRGIGEASFLKIKPLVSITPPKTERAAAQSQ